MNDTFWIQSCNQKGREFRNLPVICKSLTARATSNSIFSLFLIFSSFPGPDVMNLFRSPCWVFSNTRTDQTSSPSSRTTSQHILSILAMFEWDRIMGWPKIDISAISARRFRVLFIADRGRFRCLKMKVIRILINAWRITAILPSPTLFSADCHVIGRKSIFRLWAISRKSRKSCSWFEVELAL